MTKSNQIFFLLMMKKVWLFSCMAIICICFIILPCTSLIVRELCCLNAEFIQPNLADIQYVHENRKVKLHSCEFCLNQLSNSVLLHLIVVIIELICQKKYQKHIVSSYKFTKVTKKPENVKLWYYVFGKTMLLILAVNINLAKFKQNMHVTMNSRLSFLAFFYTIIDCFYKRNDLSRRRLFPKLHLYTALEKYK